jgi:adenylosuccinate lyase
MTRLWSPEEKYRLWLKIEILACEAMVELGRVPREALEVIKAGASFDVARIEEIERQTKHDVIAFLTSVTEKVGPEGRYLHLGLTSSDILDTTFSLQLRKAAGLLIAEVEKLLAAIKRQALRHRDTIMIGRTHGIHAEPITLGLKLAIWYQEMERHRERLIKAKENISFGKLSGAVGTYSFVDPFVETYVCARLDLKAEAVSSQIIQRDRHAEFFTTLALVASSLDKFAQEIRLLQRTEVREVEEYFSPGQKGSSAMPHKRNPVLSENLSGLSRLMRSWALAAMENVPLWHERDISHSSVERVIGEDATVLLDFMLHRFTDLMENLVVYPERMRENLALTRGVIFSQLVLLELVAAGFTREEAYGVVQRNAMAAWEGKGDFRSCLEADRDLAGKITAERLDALFDYRHFLKHTDLILARVFGRDNP